MWPGYDTPGGWTTRTYDYLCRALSGSLRPLHRRRGCGRGCVCVCVFPISAIGSFDDMTRKGPSPLLHTVSLQQRVACVLIRMYDSCARDGANMLPAASTSTCVSAMRNPTNFGLPIPGIEQPAERDHWHHHHSPVLAVAVCTVV